MGRVGQSSDLKACHHTAYPGPFVRYEDMPGDLTEVFERWQYGATMPFNRAVFYYDFENFMARGGRKGNTEIVRRYL